MNSGYLDGHVESLKYTELILDSWLQVGNYFTGWTR